MTETPAGLTVRQLGSGDGTVLKELLNALGSDWADVGGTADGPAAFLDDPQTFVFAATVDGRPAGWLWGAHITRPDGRTMTYVHQLDVMETYRRRGAALAMIEAAQRTAQHAGSYRMWLITGEHNDPARGLYKKAGATRRADQAGEIVYRWELR